jgi:hypothetical protein
VEDGKKRNARILRNLFMGLAVLLLGAIVAVPAAAHKLDRNEIITIGIAGIASLGAVYVADIFHGRAR